MGYIGPSAELDLRAPVTYHVSLIRVPTSLVSIIYRHINNIKYNVIGPTIVFDT